MKLKKIIKLIRKGKLSIFNDSQCALDYCADYLIKNGYYDGSFRVIGGYFFSTKDGHGQSVKIKLISIKATELSEMIKFDNKADDYALPDGWNLDELIPGNELLDLVHSKTNFGNFAEISIHLGFDHEFEVVIDDRGNQVLIARDV